MPPSYSPDLPAHLTDGAWYHGSPERLDVLRAGSTITRVRVVAEAFAHRPTCVSISIVERTGQPTRLEICQNGALLGYLYTIDEPVTEADVHPHPQSSFPDGGLEWLTDRPLRLRFVAEIPVGGRPDCEACPHRQA